jgi:hypothetical protein
MEDLVRAPRNKLLPATTARQFRPGPLALLDAPADVFVSAAISESITPDTLDRLERWA